MALKLPRLQRTVAIVDKAGLPVPAFQQWWQTVARAVEDIINNIIVAALVRLGAVEIQADGTATLAESAINPGGTIKDDKVLTQSIVENGVTLPSFVQTSVDIPLVEDVEITIFTLSISKDLATSDIELDCVVRLHSDDDVVGSFKLYRDATVIDTAQLVLRGASSTLKTITPYVFYDDIEEAGDFDYILTFTQNDPDGSVAYCAAGSLMRYREFLR